MNTQQTPFWLVWSPTGFAPKFSHSSFELAEQEAKRLATENPGKEFYVLEPVQKFEKQDVMVTLFERDYIPF